MEEEQAGINKCTTLFKPVNTPGLDMESLTTMNSDMSPQAEEEVEKQLAVALLP